MALFLFYKIMDIFYIFNVLLYYKIKKGKIMNFLKRIKELKKESKKVKLKDLPKWAITLPLFFILQTPMILKAVNGMLTSQNRTDFIFHMCFFSLFFLAYVVSAIAVYVGIKELKQDRLKVSDEDVNNFVLSFPEEYREIVIKNMSKFFGKKKYLSVKDLDRLENLLTIENLKSDLKALYLTNLISDSKNIVIKKEEMQNEFQK